jgi:lincosamide and streptogramin A transport system ATP-binding/permease protein
MTTNHLDMEGRKIVAEYLKRKKQGFIVVSHDRNFVNKVVDHVLSIDKSKLYLYKGNFSIYEEQKELRDKFDLEQNEKLQGEILRLKKTAKEKEDWSKSRESDKRGSKMDKGFIGHRAAKMMKRSKSIEKRVSSSIAEKEQLLKDVEFVEELKMIFLPTYRERLFQFENFTLGYNGKMLFKPLNFEVKRNQRVALSGENGIGKTALIHTLLGIFTGVTSGEVRKPERLTISFVRQDFEGNTGTLQEFVEDHHLDFETFLSNLKKLGMERSVFKNKIENMSMGQRKKVELAKSLGEEAELYIWDEPLNYLDVINHEQLEKIIREKNPTMLFIEHDQTFVDRVATQVVQLQK